MMQKWDLNEIQKQFNEVIAYSQDIDNPKTDELFSKWLEAKSHYIALFGGDLIYETEIERSYNLDPQAQKKKISRLLDAIYEDPRVSDELGVFIERFRDRFFEKTTDYEFHCLNGDVIPKGMKIIKAFNHFISNKVVLEEYQNFASRIIQENKIKGRLCFSVHPLDFLSMSESTLKWRSCHALDGEYRAGNLAYMIDEATVICYIKTDTDKILPNFPSSVLWNDKKWRMLLYFSEGMDMVFASRQYPFESKEILNYLLNSGLLCNLFHLGAPSNWDENWREDSFYTVGHKSLKEVYFPYQGYLHEIRDIFYEEKNTDFPKLAFNDVVSSSTYKPMWIAKYDYSSCGDRDKYPMFHVADKLVPCLDCGDYELTQSDMMVCKECYDDYYCDHIYCERCGRRIYADDNSYEVSSGGTVCYDCAMESTVVCDHCGMLEFRNIAISVDGDGEAILCPHCHTYWYKELSEEDQEEWLKEQLRKTE